MLSATWTTIKVSVSDVVMPSMNGRKSTGNKRPLLREIPERDNAASPGLNLKIRGTEVGT